VLDRGGSAALAISDRRNKRGCTEEKDRGIPLIKGKIKNPKRGKNYCTALKNNSSSITSA